MNTIILYCVCAHDEFDATHYIFFTQKPCRIPSKHCPGLCALEASKLHDCTMIMTTAVQATARLQDRGVTVFFSNIM